MKWTLALCATAAVVAAATQASALDACLFQPLYRHVSFESAPPTTPLSGMRSSHYGWGQVQFFTNAETVAIPQYYLPDATVFAAQQSSVQLLIAGQHVMGPVLPGYTVTVVFPRPVTEASFSFGAPLLSRNNIVAWITPIDADGFDLAFPFQASTNQSAGNYPGGGGPPIPITREGTATVNGLTFSGLRINFEPVGGFFPGFDDPTTETPREFRFDNLTWTPVLYCCPTDLNGDGQNSVDDLFNYLNAWFIGDRTADPRTDFNLSGAIDISDLFLYLNAWFTGCP